MASSASEARQGVERSSLALAEPVNSGAEGATIVRLVGEQSEPVSISIHGSGL
jgi:hypothetical protein